MLDRLEGFYILAEDADVISKERNRREREDWSGKEVAVYIIP